MRVKELKTSTEYATAEGQRVRTLGTVERGWCIIRSMAGERSLIRISDPEKLKADPWKRNKPLKARTGFFEDDEGKRVQVVQEGIRVELIPPTVGYEDAGEMQESRVTVIDPVDIKGTWADYVELHGMAVANRRIEAEARAAARDALIAFGGRVNRPEDVSIRVVPEFTVEGSDKATSYPRPGLAITGYELAYSVSVDKSDLALDVIDFLASS